jgi:hypothetical protein
MGSEKIKEWSGDPVYGMLITDRLTVRVIYDPRLKFEVIHDTYEHPVVYDIILRIKKYHLAYRDKL